MTSSHIKPGRIPGHRAVASLTVAELLEVLATATPSAPPVEGARRTYPLAEVSQLTGISLGTLRQMQADGRLATVKIGRKVYVEATELERFTRGGK